MARRAAVADMHESEQAFTAAPGMPSAPEGSAERVSAEQASGPPCAQCGWTEKDCTCPGGFTLAFDSPLNESGNSSPSLNSDEPMSEERFVTVNDYDANGEPSASTVRLEPGQSELPEMPEKVPGLWPDYQGKRVAEVHVSFSGDNDLDRESAAKTATFEGAISGTFEGRVTGHKYSTRKKGGGLIGQATVVIEQVSFGVSDGDLEAVREAAFAQAQQMISDEAAELLEMIENEGGGAPGAAEREERVRVFLRSLVMPDDDLPDEIDEDDQLSALEASLGIALGDEPEAGE